MTVPYFDLLKMLEIRHPQSKYKTNTQTSKYKTNRRNRSFKTYDHTGLEYPREIKIQHVRFYKDAGGFLMHSSGITWKILEWVQLYNEYSQVIVQYYIVKLPATLNDPYD